MPCWKCMVVTGVEDGVGGVVDRDPEVYKRPKSEVSLRLAPNCQGKLSVPRLALEGTVGVYMGESNELENWLVVVTDGTGICIGADGCGDWTKFVARRVKNGGAG